MSDQDESPEEEIDLEMASLDTEEERNAFIDWLLEQNDPDDWAQAQTIQDGNGNMVARFRWADGREEVFDLVVRRSMEVVVPSGEEGSN